MMARLAVEILEVVITVAAVVTAVMAATMAATVAAAATVVAAAWVALCAFACVVTVEGMDLRLRICTMGSKESQPHNRKY